MTVAATIAGAIAYLSEMAMWSTFLGGGRNRSAGGDSLIIAIVGMILAPIAALLIQLSISRSREYKADYSGARLLGQPLALASALQKLETANRRRPLTFGSPSTSSLFIVNPFHTSTFTRLFSTHPPIDERIKRLQDMANGKDDY